LAKSQWSFKTAVELSAALAARKVSAVELTEDAISRIERHDARINAICVRDFERGLAAARAADAELARGVKKPLLGLPVTIKESYNTRITDDLGHFRRRRILHLRRRVASLAVKDAGGIILGKTNVPLGLGDWQSYNEIYGTTNNPFDLAARRVAPPADRRQRSRQATARCRSGSDIGGSLRVPAFHCGIYAHKPTFALVPGRGHTPPPFQPLHSTATLPWSVRWRAVPPTSLCCSIRSQVRSAEAGKGYQLALPPPPSHGPKGFSRAGGRYRSADATDKVVRA